MWNVWLSYNWLESDNTRIRMFQLQLLETCHVSFTHGSRHFAVYEHYLGSYLSATPTDFKFILLCSVEDMIDNMYLTTLVVLVTICLQYEFMLCQLSEKRKRQMQTSILLYFLYFFILVLHKFTDFSNRQLFLKISSPTITMCSSSILIVMMDEGDTFENCTGVYRM